MVFKRVDSGEWVIMENVKGGNMSIQPFYEDASVILYNNDVKDVVGIIENGSIDLILTDPPYGINYVSNHRKEKFKAIENDDVLFMDIDMFWDKIKESGSLWSFYSHKVELVDKDNIYKELYNILKNEMEILSCKFQENTLSRKDFMTRVLKSIDVVEEKIKDNNFNTRIKNRIIWVKNNWTAGDLEGDFGNQYECIAFMPKDKFKLRGYRYSNVWEFGRVPPSNHATEKPVALLARIIESCTDAGDLVFDPFVGSGATLFACKRLNRRFVGCDIDKGYCQNIVNDNRLKQMGLGI